MRRPVVDGTYLIQDPYHEYGQAFIDHIHQKYGYRAVCFYTDRREMCSHRLMTQRPGSPGVAAAYEFNPREAERFVETVSSRHLLFAVIPFNETSVVLAADLAQRLGLGWGQPDVMRLFRDKFAFKQAQRESPLKPRMNASFLVTDRREIFAARRAAPFLRFILKPNDGYGNRLIGYFDRSSSDLEIERYLCHLQGITLVMEEYVDGIEYFVNGQVDASGVVTTIAIFEYRRVGANGRHNIDFETTRVRHDTSLFRQLAQYACRVIQASRLIRSPFHLELKVDACGPCLIEAAARLAGHGNGLLSGELHGPAMSTIALAAHYYLGADPFGPLPLDWERYDTGSVRYVHGIAASRERVLDLKGVAEVEALPEFHQWIKQPVVGMRTERTVDALTMPWSLVLRGDCDERTMEVAQEVRRLLCWNAQTGVFRRQLLTLRFAFSRLLRKVRRSMLRDWGMAGRQDEPLSAQTGSASAAESSMSGSASFSRTQSARNTGQ